MRDNSNVESFSLPNGQVVSCVSRESAAAIWHELGATFETWCASDLGIDDTVINVGAHVGLASLRLARLAGREPRIVACEPAPTSFACLEQNLAWHLPSSRALNVAVGRNPGVATLSYYPHAETMSTMCVDEADDRTNVGAALDKCGVTDESERARYWSLARSDVAQYRVRVLTLAEIATAHGVGGVGLIKFDVERAELDVLHGSEGVSVVGY